MTIKISPSPLCGTVAAPASKSVAHRMLICAALADEKSEIIINASSQDIEATAECLKKIGAKISVCNDKWEITPAANVPKKVRLDCGESGSTLRFMLPVVSALGIDAVLDGHGKLPSRPVEPLLEAMCKNGVAADNAFPVHVNGKLQSGSFKIAGNISSQFVTGLLLALPLCSGESAVELIPPVESKSYIDITVSVLKQFGIEVEENGNKYSVHPSIMHGGKFITEGDWSNAAFWLASGVNVSGLNMQSFQGDKKIVDILKNFGAKINILSDGINADVSALRAINIDASDIPDLVPVISAIAATADGTTKIYNASRLRLKESDRIKTTAQMIRSLGGQVEETADGLKIFGKDKLSGGTVDSFNDHRIAMAAAVAARKCAAPVIIKNAQAVNKSYPEFFNEYKLLGGIADVM
jgi:3-phosphoshikimate 1-carboxyvinyltransferase